MLTDILYTNYYSFVQNTNQVTLSLLESQIAIFVTIVWNIINQYTGILRTLCTVMSSTHAANNPHQICRDTGDRIVHFVSVEVQNILGHNK